MSLELTNGQKAAIKEYGKNIIVSAGAGSGKTFVLTERVIYFIKEHVLLKQKSYHYQHQQKQ